MRAGRETYWLKGCALTTSLIAVYCSNGGVWAFAVPPSTAITQSARGAEVICVARLQKYVQNDRYHFAKLPEQLYQFFTLKKPGVYSFHVITALKGAPEAVIVAAMPEIVSRFYNFARLNLEEGSYALLMVNKGEDGIWHPIDPTLPLIPLSADIVAREEIQKCQTNIADCVTIVLLQSLDDPTRRRAIAFLLQDVVDNNIAPAMERYIEDPDPITRGSILYCMVTNQQMHVIPNIARLEDSALERDNGTEAVSSLGKFSTPSAVPYLNPLLWERSPFTRINASFSLRKLADRGTLPFLVLGLMDSDPDVAYQAYYIFLRLNPSLGRPVDLDYFEVHRDKLVIPLYDWWSNHMSAKDGKTQKAEYNPKIAEALHEYVPQETVTDLMALLYDTEAQNRISAIKSFTGKVDRKILPYLMLALRDPQPTVVYEAYTLLHTAIDGLRAAKSREEFEKNRDSELSLLFGWWKDELSGKHLQIKRPLPPPR